MKFIKMQNNSFFTRFRVITSHRVLQLLSKMFNDRAPSFNSMLKMGKEIIESQPDEEGASKTKEDLDKVTELWNILNNDVQDRKSKLDGLLPVSQEFLAKLDAASKIIGNVNGNLDDKKWQPCATEDDIAKQIQELMVRLISC